MSNQKKAFPLMFFCALALLISCSKSSSKTSVTTNTPPSNADIITTKVIPSVTDPNINTFSDAQYQNHLCYVNPKVASRKQLLVFFPGSNGTPVGYKAFSQFAANLGYNVICLMYPDSPSVGKACENSTDPNCFYNVRMEVFDGVDRGALISVNPANSIKNRLIKCIKYLSTNYPTQNWGQYLTANDSLVWNEIVVSGHSQGGGHAALIAKNHAVARVVCLASPKDTYITTTGLPANWINENNLTPPANYYTFTHALDVTEATEAQQQNIFTALGLRTIADSVNVDITVPPYNNSRILMTNVNTANGIAIQPHLCVAEDGYVPDIQSFGTNKYAAVWTYMLTN